MAGTDEPLRGARGRIGFLWPADGLNDDEYWRCLPDGVALLTARYAVTGGLTLDHLEADADLSAILGAARLLELARVDVAALGDCAGAFVAGTAGERALAAAVAAELGTPATTMCGAILAALEVFGARRITLIAPYPAAVVDRFEAVFGSRGIAVARRRALELDKEQGVAALPPARWHEIARDADGPEAEAVVLGGGGLRAAAALEAMERDLGKPVIAGPAALVWHACRLIDVDATGPDLGRLFAEHGSAVLPA